MIKYIVPCVAILAIIVFILSPKLYRAKNKEEEFSYLNYFPVEAPLTYKQKIINIFLTGVLAFLCAESYVSSLLVTSLTNVGLISSLILFVVSSLAYFLANCFTLESYKAHLISFVIAFVSHIGGSVLIAITLLTSEMHLEIVTPIAVIMGVLGLIQLMNLLIPKLKDWMLLDKTEIDGHVTYVRPQTNSLCIVEWLYVVFELMNIILLLINNILIK